MEQNYSPTHDLTPVLTEISGERIHLRPLTEWDLTPTYLEWFTDADVTMFLDARDISLEEAREHLNEGLLTQKWAMLAVVHNDQQRHIGNVKIGPIDWGNGVSDLVTVIGDQTMWGLGLAADAIELAGNAAFQRLGMRKLSGGVIEGNEGSLRAYGKAGWVVEGTLKGHVLRDGDSRDRILISRFNPAYFAPGPN